MRKLLLMLVASVFSLTAFAGVKVLGVIQGRYVSEDVPGMNSISGYVEDQLWCEGLPEGLECVPEYDYWEDETYVYIEGVVTAEPGTYNVTFYKGEKLFKKTTLKVYAMPKITGTFTASSSTLTLGRDLYDNYGNELECSIEKTEKATINVDAEMVNGELTKCDYSVKSAFWEDDLTLDDPRQGYDFQSWVYANVNGKEGVVCNLWLSGYLSWPYYYYENYVTLFFANSGEVTCFAGYYKTRSDGEYSYYILEQDAYSEWGAPIKMTCENITNIGSGTGKITYTGLLADGNTMTLKSTVNKGSIFAGWYLDPEGLQPLETAADYRTASLSYTVAEDVEAIYAKFVTAEDDTLLTLAVYEDGNKTEIGDSSATFRVDGPKELIFDIGSNSIPKATVKGLPAGMKFTAKPVMKKGSKTEVEYPANCIYGAPTKPGVYTVTVSLTNATVKKAVTKTFNIEVPNLKAPGVIDVYNRYGEYVPGVSYIEEVPEAEGCTVTGLPAGMKWTAKALYKKGSKTEIETPANSVYGIPTTPGNYTVYFTKTVNKEKHTATATFVVGSYPQLTVDIPESSDGKIGGKVTGAGAFAANKKVTLKATASKGYVFAGWYKDGVPCDSTSVDYRNPSYTYVMGEDDTQFYARFVTKEEEADYEMGIELIDEYYISLGDDVQIRAGEVMEPVKVWVDSLTLPTATVTGLPTGLKFDAKTFTISGKPTKPGFYPITIEVKNASKSRSTFAIVNLEVCHFNAHGLHGDWEDAEPIVIDAFTTELFDVEDWFGGFFEDIPIKSLKLPAGLTYNAKAGTINGNGKLKSGSYTVTLTDKAGQVTTFTLVAELSNDDMFTYLDYLSPDALHSNAYYECVVQGAKTSWVLWMEILKYNGNSSWGAWDDCYFDEATAKAISVKVTGLPNGLNARLEKDWWYHWEETENGEEFLGKVYECNLWLEGKTSAAPGDYPVTVTIANSLTGQVEYVSSVIRIVLPPSISSITGSISLTSTDFYDNRGNQKEANGQVVYNFNQASGKADYTITAPAPSVVSGSLPVDSLSARVGLVGLTETLIYHYLLYKANSKVMIEIEINDNGDGTFEVGYVALSYQKDGLGGQVFDYFLDGYYPW